MQISLGCNQIWWQVGQTKTNWTSKIEQIILNKRSISQKPIYPNYYLNISQLTKIYLNRFYFPKIQLNNFFIEQISTEQKHVEHCELNMILFNWPLYNFKEYPSHNESKPQWIQAIGVRGVINFFTCEERSDRAVLATWPPGRRLVRFEPSHNQSKPQSYIEQKSIEQSS